MESLLPSEIARLVYGYLVESNCDEAARKFLEHSCHLAECLAATKEGKRFSTRPLGYYLTDILDEYWQIHSMVAECSQKLPKNSADMLRQCDSLIEQLRCLIDSSQAGQMLLASNIVPPEESPAKGTSRSVTPTAPTHSHLRRIASSNRMKRSSHSSKQQCSKDAHDALSSKSINPMASSGKEKKIEGTSLEDQNAAAIQCIVDAKMSTQSNPTFLDNNASFSLNTETNSNSVTNPSPFKMQLSAPLDATSQPSLSAAPTKQVTTVVLPGTTGPVQQAAARSGLPLDPPCEKAAPHLLATSSSSQVVAITTPGPQNANSAVMDHMPSVMCRNDGVVPQFGILPLPHSWRGSYLVLGPCRRPILPRGAVILKARTVHQDAKPSKNARFGAGNPSAAFAPKKRKTPSEGLSLPEEKRIRTDEPRVLPKKLDFVHGEKLG